MEKNKNVTILIMVSCNVSYTPQWILLRSTYSCTSKWPYNFCHKTFNLYHVYSGRLRGLGDITPLLATSRNTKDPMYWYKNALKH